MSSVLLPLQPRGMGTGQVEAFASYFGRLAQLHICSLHQLAQFLSSWESRELGRRVTLSGSTLYETKGSGMSSYGVCVEAYVDAVEHAMRVDNLRRCTLIPIRCALSPQRVAPGTQLQTFRSHQPPRGTLPPCHPCEITGNLGLRVERSRPHPLYV